MRTNIPLTEHDLEAIPPDGRRYLARHADFGRRGVVAEHRVDRLEPEEERYERVAKTVGDEPFEAGKPFPARVVLNELLGRLAGR
ncbi:hypothetical protein [Amycolatopsis xylanica]|uniref:hypothetical protein n=1 Tax=Amycolatopsis xylanica TaxID=589385 RepID=UPI00115FA7DA|nr:hypothetical protein [Amycolatopsis xylanica]